MVLAQEKVQLDPETTICEYVREEDLNTNTWRVACTTEQPQGQLCGLFDLGGLVKDPSYKYDIEPKVLSALRGEISVNEEA